MIVVDTNVVVRFAVNDDPDQAAIARTLFEDHTVSISRTVALETEWVLRSRYGNGRKQIAGETGIQAGAAARVRLAQAGKITPPA